MLQEYWLLLPQRLELVQYLSPAEHGVCNRQSADYGFTPVPLSSTEIRLPEQHLVEVLPHRRVYLYILLLYRAVCILESTNGWSLA